MAKPEWGKKRTCQVCGKKYYDLNKSPIICPCPEAVEFDPNDHLRTRKSRSVPLKNSEENDNDLTQDIENIEIDANDEGVSDDDPLLEINQEDKNVIADDEIDMDNDISFINDDVIEDDDNSINVEINEDDKN
tara:strand:- start:356 stop:754 length:399 start_codon:yes stop_codon:yes gene_type:complete